MKYSEGPAITVGELIEQLQKFDKSLPIYVEDADTGWLLDRPVVSFVTTYDETGQKIKTPAACKIKAELGYSGYIDL